MSYSPELYEAMNSLGLTRKQVDSCSQMELKQYAEQYREIFCREIICPEFSQQSEILGGGDDPELQKAIEESIAASQASQSFNQSEPQPDVKQKSILPLDDIPQLATEDILIQNRNLSNRNELIRYRKEIAESVAIPDCSDRTRYSEKLNLQLKELEPEDGTGITISVVFIDGSRESRKFHENTTFKSVYLWCASFDCMKREQIRLGSFILVDSDGTEIYPKESLTALTQHRILLFMRLVD